MNSPIKCPFCSKIISENVEKCIYCDKAINNNIKETTKQNPLKKGLGIILLLTILFSPILLFYAFASNYSEEDLTLSKRFKLLYEYLVKSTPNPVNTQTYEPQSNPLDNSVYQVKDYLQKHLKDPNSYQSIEWSSVQKTKDGIYFVRNKYRAKNSFNGYTISNQIFYLNSSGDVLQVINIP